MSGGNGGAVGLSTEELRTAVRAVLRDVLPSTVTDVPRAAGPIEAVALHSDADLAAFVRRIAARCDEPAERAALKDGRCGFRLAATEGSASAAPPTDRTLRVERGPVTERMVKRAAADGVRLVLGPAARLTPLARDRARVLGVPVEREER